MKSFVTTVNALRESWLRHSNTVQKVKFSIKDFFSKCNQIRRRILPHLLKKSLVETFFCAVQITLLTSSVKLSKAISAPTLSSPITNNSPHSSIELCMKLLLSDILIKMFKIF